MEKTVAETIRDITKNHIHTFKSIFILIYFPFILIYFPFILV